MFDTPIMSLGEYQGNRLYIKREDMIPYSFGGNKARKAFLFFQEIDTGKHDCVVTYGSSSSNHCRIIANLCAGRHLPCYIISPMEASEETFNSKFMQLFGAHIEVVAVQDVHDTIERTISELKQAGKNPYFIPGGGHGNIGTHAFCKCYEEIRSFEESKNLHFDYIFFASGTGTTQAGLVCGQLIHKDDRKIVGISIARKNPRGRDIVLQSMREYLGAEYPEEDLQACTHFIDDYTGSGYAGHSEEVERVIDDVMTRYGIPLDPTYTGKAFFGMQQHLFTNCIAGKNVLFIHTGGTPLYFDYLKAGC